MDIDRMAEEAMGNWRRFESFCWDRAYELEDADSWCIVYGANRDSGLLDQSNAEATDKALESFMDGDNPDVLSEHHGHWGCGWVDGWAIRVRDSQGALTPAFRAYCELQEALEDYPVLDEEDYSRREYEATIENLSDAARGLDYELPEGWESEVFSWLWDHGSMLEALGIPLEWCDEWDDCSECNGLLRHQPDSYGWTPSYSEELLRSGEMVCLECAE
jgi:hypothetical protein